MLPVQPYDTRRSPTSHFPPPTSHFPLPTSPMSRLDKLRKILAAEPTDAFTLYGVAQEYAKAGDTASAVEFYNRCLAADPAYCYAYYHKAKCQADADDP